MLYNTLHNIETISNKAPQKAMSKLIHLDKEYKIQLGLALADVTSRGGALLGHNINTLTDLKKHWTYELDFDKSHNNSGMVVQDKAILQAINSYATKHHSNEWTNLNLDFKNNVYTLQPIDNYIISDIAFTILNKQDY